MVVDLLEKELGSGIREGLFHIANEMKDLAGITNASAHGYSFDL